MLAKTYSYGISGLDSYPITIEVDSSRGLPSTIIVGLPDNAVKESKERVKAAIRNSGYKFPHLRITVNLSPADIKKEGPSFDLAIALGILASTDQIPYANLKNYVFLGELSLDGNIKPVNGALSVAMSINSKSNLKGLIVPSKNAYEAAISNNINIFPANNLNEVIHFLTTDDKKPLEFNIDSILKNSYDYDVDFADVKGQTHVKRGLEIAAAGGHNILLIGPPGSGKSMLAKRIPTILPDMTLAEALETTKIHSVMGTLKPNESIITKRPFRAPHHTTSDVAIVGGGSTPKPGEVTLSHNGVLFLDELPEFNRNVLETLRQPLEDNVVTVSRAAKSSRFPSNFMLVAAMNPCPCGWYIDPKKTCCCSANQIHKYMSKISGPLLDRIDIHLEVPSLPSYDLLSHKTAETSQVIKKRTSSARKIQIERFKDTNIKINASMNHKQLKKYCPLNEDCKKLLKNVIDELGISARAYDKILKVARTIVDLEDKDSIEVEHISEAIQYRCLDRNWW